MNDEFTEQGIKLFDVCDGDECWAGPDFETTFAAALEMWGFKGEEAKEARDVAYPDPINLDTFKVQAEEGSDDTITAREYIRELIASGSEFPMWACGRE